MGNQSDNYLDGIEMKNFWLFVVGSLVTLIRIFLLTEKSNFSSEDKIADREVESFVDESYLTDLLVKAIFLFGFVDSESADLHDLSDHEVFDDFGVEVEYFFVFVLFDAFQAVDGLAHQLTKFIPFKIKTTD